MQRYAAMDHNHKIWREAGVKFYINSLCIFSNLA